MALTKRKEWLMNRLTYPREQYDESNLDKALILKIIREHSTARAALLKKKQYYLGEHAHDKRDNGPDNKVVSNHAKDITDTATGYFMGEAIRYTTTGDEDIERLLEAFDNADVDENDHDNALDMSIYGVAYEYIYAREDSNELDIKNLEPENTFIVYDDSIEQRPLFAVYYFKQQDVKSSTPSYTANIFTESFVYTLSIDDTDKSQNVSEVPFLHNLGEVPVVEYQNNKYRIGDFEQQISLIDAYNKLSSTRINDKEQFIDAILLLTGADFADDPADVKQAAEALKELKMLEPPNGAKAEYLTRTLDEVGAETLRRALKEDIYTFSHVPNLSDENFAGNSSGVAMEFKLLGLLMITKIKERYYKKGLKKRLRIFANRLGLSNLANEVGSIVPQFSRGLPKNLLELSQIVSNLQGKVTDRTLISLLPFVEDPDHEIEQLGEQKQANIERQQELIGAQSNEPLGGEEDGEAEE